MKYAGLDIGSRTIKLVVVELVTDYSQGDVGQIKTRIEGLFESIR